MVLIPPALKGPKRGGGLGNFTNLDQPQVAPVNGFGSASSSLSSTNTKLQQFINETSRKA